jgi:predicted Zn-dependent protease/phage tail protein X
MKNVFCLLLLVSCSQLQMKTELRVSRAHHFYETQDYAQTISEINQLKDSNHFSPELSILAAQAFTKLGKPAKGDEELNFYLKKNPLSGQVTLALAESLTAQKKYNDSRKVLFEAIQKKSVDQRLAWTQVARNYSEESNWDLLVKLDRLTVERTSEIDFLVGQAFYKKRNYRAAVPRFQSTFDNNYEKEKSLEYLTYLFHGLDDLESAKKSLASLLEINKKNTVAEKMFFRLILKEKSFDKLSVLYLYERTYSDTWAKNEIVATLTERGNEKKAIEYIAEQKQKDVTGPWIDQAYTQALEPQKASVVERLPASRFHIVKNGDTLRLISMTYFGTKQRWDDIYHLNKSNLANSDVLPSGIKLKLPD